jgi:hypothetical protein
MKQCAHKDRADPPEYSKGDLRMQGGKNLQTPRPCKKLNNKLHGPFEITELISETAMPLHLPVT